jgi:hypothetical protein
MKLSIRNIATLLDTYGVTVQDRGYMLALGLARSLAYALSIPSSKVESAYVYYAMTHSQVVGDILSQVNEAVVISFDLAKDLTKQLWIMRYNVVWVCDNEVVNGMLDEALSNGAEQMPPKARELYDRYEARGLMREIDRAVVAALDGGL